MVGWVAPVAVGTPQAEEEKVARATRVVAEAEVRAVVFRLPLILCILRKEVSLVETAVPELSCLGRSRSRAAIPWSPTWRVAAVGLMAWEMAETDGSR
jgi:hypothetical protein